MVADTVRFSLKAVSFLYPDGTEALSDVDLRIKRGEFAGILGINGSGKTTLLKVMDGLLKDFKGSLCLDEDEIRSLSAKQIYRKVGLIFQNPDDQLFAATLFEDVAFGPRNMGFEKDEVKKRVLNALELVGLAGLEAKPIYALSFGQKKRACLAGLLAMGHEILLLDEPTAGLDPRGEQRMLSLLKKLSREKAVTVIMATHSIDLIPLFLDRLYVLHNTRIVLQGSPREVFSQPQVIRNAALRPPHITHLFEVLQERDGVTCEDLPLTIGAARQEIVKLTIYNAPSNK